MTTLSVHVPTKMKMPLGAWLAAAAFARVLQVVHQLRATRQERRRQEAFESDVVRVRHYAQQMMDIDPRFASDLFAAADRHERAETAGQ